MKILRTKIPTKEELEEIHKVIAMGDPRRTVVADLDSKQLDWHRGTEDSRGLIFERKYYFM